MPEVCDASCQIYSPLTCINQIFKAIFKLKDLKRVPGQGGELETSTIHDVGFVVSCALLVSTYLNI
jgi:hypothetical protein